MAPPWLKHPLLSIWRRLPLWLQVVADWVLQSKFLVGTSAVILDDEGRVLLFKHTYRMDYAWGLPGGWLKAGEDPRRAIEREIEEESGYRIRTLHPLVIGGDRAIRRLDLIYFCELVGGTFCSSPEVSEGRFFTIEELPGYLEPFHVEVVVYANQLLHGERGGVRPPPPEETLADS